MKSNRLDISIEDIQWIKVYSINHPADLLEEGFFKDHEEALNKNEDDENEAFKSVAVSPEWVLEQHGVHYKGPDESRSKVITEL